MTNIVELHDELDPEMALLDLEKQADLMAVIASSDEIVHPYVQSALTGFEANLRMYSVRLGRVFEKLDEEIRALRAAATAEPQPEPETAET